MPDPVVIDPSAARAVLTSLVRHILTLVGSALVAKGFVPEAVASSAISPLADQIVGALILAASAGWAAWKAKHTNDKLVTVAGAAPDHVAVVATTKEAKEQGLK